MEGQTSCELPHSLNNLGKKGCKYISKVFICTTETQRISKLHAMMTNQYSILTSINLHLTSIHIYNSKKHTTRNNMPLLVTSATLLSTSTLDCFTGFCNLLVHRTWERPTNHSICCFETKTFIERLGTGRVPEGHDWMFSCLQTWKVSTETRAPWLGCHQETNPN